MTHRSDVFGLGSSLAEMSEAAPDGGAASVALAEMNGPCTILLASSAILRTTPVPATT
jgi:hypothetical protein